MEHLPDDLAHALIAAEPRLAGLVNLHYFSEVESTNDIALVTPTPWRFGGHRLLADFSGLQGASRPNLVSPPGAGMYLWS
jgi:hypothetical protein